MVKKYLLIASSLFVFPTTIDAQSNSLKSITDYFDEKQAIEQAKAKGITPSEINGYVQFLKQDLSSQKALEKQAHKHSPYEAAKGVLEQVVYLRPNAPAGAGCPNMSFEQGNFLGWTGSYGTIGVGSTQPSYSTTSPTILNSAGNNVSLLNTTNYHTLMTLLPTNSNYPNCNGYDSLACKAVGTNTVSEIPFISPYSVDNVSVRLNGAVSNYRGCRLKYITTTSSTNKQLSFSCAFVLQNASHSANESPYFKVEVRNETTGLLIPGCNSFSVNMGAVNPADSLKTSAIDLLVSYRKWNQYIVDLSSLAAGTNVSVSFEVGDCAQGGHWGYAYVDAECGTNAYNSMTSNMCSGSSSAILTAPMGFTSYQWYDPSNNIIAGATGYSLNVNSAVAGNIYSVKLTSPGGCIQTQTVAIANSTISVTSLTTTGSCLNGISGSATAYVSGSNSAYSYTWTSVSTGSVVGNSQTAINLSPGNYSVSVSSGNCGQTSATVSVPVLAAQLTQQNAPYCGNSAYIAAAAGTNYQWYNGTTLIPAPEGTNDTLFIPNPANGNKYTVTYTDPGSCRDSVRYTLNLISFNSVYFSYLTNACPGGSNGSVMISIDTTNAQPYNYIVTGPLGQITNTTIATTSLTVNGLAAGIYSTSVHEGICIHNSTFTINTIQTNFTMTPNNPGPCSSADTARIGFNFGNMVSSSCGLSSAGNCSSPNSIQVGNGTLLNTSTSWPAVYGNWYKNSRHQILYKASELIAAGVLPGKLSGVSFNISSVTGAATVYPGFTIKLKCTSASSLTTAFDNAGLTQVYYNSNQTVTTGWNTHSFPVAYEWDGISNIIVDVCYAITSNYTGNCISPCTNTSYMSVNYFYSDATVACQTSNAGTTSSIRPNIKFLNCGGINPSTYTISVSSNGIITHNYNNDSIKIVPVVTPTADIVYTITVTNPEGGCIATQEYTMTATPSGVITTTNASCGSCPNGSVSVTPSCGAAPYSYLWAPGGETTQSIGGLLPGCYTVTITDANGQTATESACVTFSTKLSDLDLIEGLSVYPNPNNGLFNIISQEKLESLTITIINPIGQTVMTETAKNTSQIPFDLGKLSKGIYYLKASTDRGSKLFKLILE